MTATIREMSPGDYEAVLALWQASDGVGLSDADAPDQIGRFLERNPGLSLVALVDDELVGAVLCGHDGRRGYLHHLAVHPDYRQRGIGRQLVQRCLAKLGEAGIQKCHLFVFKDNEGARTFWQRTGWTPRTELRMMSRLID